MTRDDEREREQQAGHLDGEGKSEESRGKHHDPRQNEVPLRETCRETSDEPALHHDPHQAHEDPEDGHLPICTSRLRAAVTLLGREREGPVEDGERQGHEEKLTNAVELCRDARREFERIRQFLTAYLAREGDLAAKTE